MSSISKEAKAEYDRAYRAKNRERIAEVKRLAHLANPELQAARAKKWDALNPELSLAAKQAYRARNPEKDGEYYRANLPEVKAQRAVYRAANKSKISAAGKDYRNANPEVCKQRALAAYSSRRAEIIANTAAWRVANPDKYAAQLAKAALTPRKPRTPEQKARHASHQSLRCRRLLCARPPWADRDAITAIYLKAQQMGMHVDHIIPLKGKLVSGLHVEGNLQLLTPSENLRKRNKFSQEAHNAH